MKHTIKLLLIFLLMQCSNNPISSSPIQEEGEWLIRKAMPTARQEIPHAVLDGKIYIPGGFTASRAATNIVEVYDPATDDWSTAPPLPVAMHHLHLAAANGTLYILGGYETSSFARSNRVLELDLPNNRWNPKKSLPTPRGAGIAVAFEDKIYVIGGAARPGASGTNEMYDPVTDDWISRAPMLTAREHLAGALVDSLIYIAGGRVSGSNMGTLEVYSPKTNEWRTLKDMPTPRGGNTAASANGRLYVFGGEFFDDGSGVFNEAEEYDPATNSWRQMAAMPSPRHGIGAATIGGDIYIIGGGSVAGFGVTNVNSIFRPPVDVTSVAEESSSQQNFVLEQNYPNPFNPNTTIRFRLKNSSQVTLRIYDLSGREVITLVDGRLNAGEHAVRWQANSIGSGVYVYELKAGGFVETKKMLLLR